MENELFEKTPVPKAYFTMALPVVFAMVVSLVYNMVDTFFIARTQNTNLVAGVSLCAPVFTLMIALGDIFGLGGSAIISRLFGEKKYDEGKNVSGFCFYAAIICGICVTTVMLAFKTPILKLLGASADTMQYAADYYGYMALGATFIIVSMTPSNMLRTEGLAVQSMLGTIVGSVVNIILDPIFIFGLNMGAGGAAIATVISNVVVDIILLYFVVAKSHKLTISPKYTKVSLEVLRGIFAIGIPASITNIMQSFGVTLTNRYLSTYGTEKVAAMGIALKINMIVVLVLVGFAFGAQPLLGYNYGAKNKERLNAIIKFDLLVEVGFSIVIAGIIMLMAPKMVGLFMSDTGVISAGGLMVRCMLMSTPLIGVVLVFTTLFQSEGKALPAFILSISRQGVVLAACMCVLNFVFGYKGVICAQASSDVLTALMAITLYKIGKVKN